MIAIIIGLIVALIVFVIVISAVQQHKEKQEAEKRTKVAKQKAIIDESEGLILNLGNLPSSPNLVKILNRRSLNAAKAMQTLMPKIKGIESRIQELNARLEAAEDLAKNQGNEEVFMVPDNEQQILTILQCIKKIRATLKSEQSKGTLDAQTFTKEDQRLDAMQLKINIESIVKRGSQAQSKEMLGSARQYFEKALQTLANHPIKSEYVASKQSEITNQLAHITDSLKSTNANDAAKKAKSEENELDLLFQPKKKW
ncbi:MAG: FeoB-associated Cys-rich membrane protein [Colwellia sp.]|nr:FeoB-associated Cys-rich membrane protein [Colwellia sp.]